MHVRASIVRASEQRARAHTHTHDDAHAHTHAHDAPVERMRAALISRVGATHVDVADVSGGCGSFYQLLVVSPQFLGQPVLAQHRAVHAALGGDVGAMHGLTLVTYTPAQWAKQRPQQ